MLEIKKVFGSLTEQGNPVKKSLRLYTRRWNFSIFSDNV